jgi:hypothetical protein
MLLDICFGFYYPCKDKIQPVSAEFLSSHDLDKLTYMMLVEFAASVEKERRGAQEESQVKAKPKPYDVFVMKTSFGSHATNISVVLPMRGGQLWWWNGQADFASLDSDQHVYRIASLSGTARVLECLHMAKEESRGSLSVCAMRREMLVGIDNNSTNPPESSAIQNSQLVSCWQPPWQHRELYDMDNYSSPTNPPESSFMKSTSQFLSSIPQPSVGSAQPTVGSFFPLVDSSILEPLNESQQQAVLTAASAKFQDGFFAVQGENLQFLAVISDDSNTTTLQHRSSGVWKDNYNGWNDISNRKRNDRYSPIKRRSRKLGDESCCNWPLCISEPYCLWRRL